jgi:hypothetical protein
VPDQVRDYRYANADLAKIRALKRTCRAVRNVGRIFYKAAMEGDSGGWPDPLYPPGRPGQCTCRVALVTGRRFVMVIVDASIGLVKKWVKNDRLGFFIPYRNKGVPARYVPDFILETDTGLNVIAEIKGQVTDSADVKAKAAQRWANAVNRLGQHGMWRYLLVTDPGTLGKALNAYTTAKWVEGQFELR